MKNKYLKEDEKMEQQGDMTLDGPYSRLFASCLKCKHYIREKAGEYLCLKYPDGIPPDIWEGKKECRFFQK